MQRGNFIDIFFSSTCFGYIRPSSRALDVELQHMVFCTEFLDGWWSCEPLCRSCVRCGWCRALHHPHRTHDQRSGSQDHHPSKNSVQKTICCNSISNALDDGRMYPKHVELKNINKITSLHQVGVSLYFMRKMHGQTTLNRQKLSRNKTLKSTVEPQAEAWNTLLSLGLRLRHQCHILTLAALLKPIFEEELINNKGDYRKCRIMSFLKMFILRRSFR